MDWRAAADAQRGLGGRAATWRCRGRARGPRRQGRTGGTAGLLEGDLILSFAGQPIKHARQLPRYRRASPIGEEAEALIVRGGERKTVKIKVAQLETAVPELSSAPPKSKRQKYGKISFGP